MDHELLTLDYDLGRGITAFSTLRGDFSPNDPYSGFNACHYVGDSPGHVDRCRRTLAAFMGITPDRLIIPRQSHSSSVAVIDSIPVDPAMLDGADALVTCLDGVALCVNTADCVPLLLADPEAGVTAAVHSGWRGTVARITAHAVTEMKRMGAHADRIRVQMGPSICMDCFEVGDEVSELFIREFGNDKGNIVSCSMPRPHISLASALMKTLSDAGISEENISQPPECPRCGHDRFFSARKLGIGSGRTLSLIFKSDLLD